MEIMDNPERTDLDLFGDLPVEERARLDEEVLAKQKRLAAAWKQGGKAAVRRELEKMYPEMAAAKRQS